MTEVSIMQKPVHSFAEQISRLVSVRQRPPHGRVKWNKFRADNYGEYQALLQKVCARNI